MEPLSNDVKDIGPYRLVGVLGEGGMGVVYAAEQRQPIVRRVALKVVKVGMDTREVLARFEAERQALALLDHPNIAKVIDAGATALGRPYFAMELVRGLPITRYCDEARLSVQKRVEVFLQACAAIQHAHVRGILHRDVKPSNLLVMEVDGAPVVKVIDFGLAKAMNQRLTERTLFTEEGRIIGTPEYMSPEQAETSAQDVDARSDVFSLGVVLYELIAGALPFDFRSARAKGYFEVQRCIREDEPPTPRQRLSGMRGQIDQVLALRRCRMQELAASLRHGLDAVTMKAIAKARGDRYASCEDFAADLRRFLAGDPVSARTPGLADAVAHRLRRLRRRNPAAMPAVLLATLVGIGTWWGTRREADPPRGSSPTSAPSASVARQGALQAGQQVGEWQVYYESGQPRARGRFDADQQVGVWTFYHENGRVELNGSYDHNGKRTGEWMCYHPDGRLRAKGAYLDDLEDGPWTFFGPDGVIERQGQYDRGQESGFWQYSESGGVRSAQGMCHRGARIGIWRVSAGEGKAEAKQNFGGLPGLVIVNEAWPNGRRRRAGLLQDGVAAGRWTTWHENGGLRFCCAIVAGRVCGVFEARRSNGDLLACGVLDDGEFGEPSFAFESGKTRPIRPGELPRRNVGWDSAAFAGDSDAENVVASLCAEVLAPIDVAAETPVTSAPDDTGVTRGRDPTAEPAPVQPVLSVVQQKEVDGYMRSYLEDQQAVAALEMQERLKKLGVIRTATGAELSLAEFAGKRKVLIVFLRGFMGEICVYCTAQTKALVQQRSRLTEHAVETIVVYPGPRENADGFLQAYRTTFGADLPPYHIVYDPGLEMAATLGIDGGDPVKPTTILIDEHGAVRALSVGAFRADRPASRELVRIIESLDG